MAKAPKRPATRVGRRESRPRTGQLSSIEPRKLVNVLERAQRGDTRDFADLCDRLYWYDGHIRGNYDTRLAQVAASPWQITPGKSRDPKRQAAAAEGAAFATTVLEELDDFDTAIMEWADGIGVGWGVTETLWDTINKEDVPIGFEWLHPRRFTFGEEWEIRIVDNGEEFDSQGEDLRDFPHGQFVVHMPRFRGSYPGVAGGFRGCSWIYLFRRWSTQFWVRGMEKFAWPTILATVKKGAGAEVRAVMNTALRDAADSHHLTIEDGELVSYLETLVKDAGSWSSLDQALKDEASKILLGASDLSEAPKVGSFGAVKTRKGLTVDSRSAVDARQLSKTIRAQVIQPLMEFNTKLFGGVEPATPEFTFDISGTRPAISQTAIGAGAVTVDEIREREGLPLWGGERGARVVTGEEERPEEPPAPERPQRKPAPNRRPSARRRP